MNKTAAVRTTHRGRLFTVEVHEVEGSDGKKHEREIVRHPGAVLILPVLDDERGGRGGRVVMIRNYRIAPDETLWELPAGKLEKGEEPAKAAARELEEETGYTAKHICKIGEFYTSPGFADELMRVYVAEGLTEGETAHEPGEQIEVRVVSLDEAMNMAINGTVRDGKSIAALLMWERMRRRDGETVGG